MKIINNNFKNNQIIDLHDNLWLEKQRYSGKIVSQTLLMLENLIKEKTQLTLFEIDKIVEEFIIKNGCSPTFKNYKGFPNSLCASINKILVHGIPGDQILQDGDLVSFDLGATFEGVISDAARTMIFGQAKHSDHEILIQTTKECLEKAIGEVKIGKKIGVIGNSIFKHARGKGFAVVDAYGGHSISRNREDPNNGIPHAPPFISNKAEINEGPTIQAGMSIAIEPLLVLGLSNKTKVLGDGWSVEAENLSAHEENTIFVKDNGEVEILTK